MILSTAVNKLCSRWKRKFAGTSKTTKCAVESAEIDVSPLVRNVWSKCVPDNLGVNTSAICPYLRGEIQTIFMSDAVEVSGLKC
jgi:hypothetical protein